MLKTKMIVMERYEKSLLEMIKPEKGRKLKAEAGHSVFKQKQLEKSEDGKIKYEIPRNAQNESPESLIHFKCKCGQKIKVPQIYAGRTGRCPKCSARIIIPQS
jgi:DNA-directed RNA polymerase subunit RPC12/RpoP